MNRPIASLSLDLDNQWSYMKTHGDPGWESFPSYLDIVVPRFLEIFRERGLQMTVFVVGQDAALDKNHTVLASVADAGHEIGNHSVPHEPWLPLYSDAEVEEELATAEEHITTATGQRPVGFRGPGFSCSPAVLKCLAERGYLYDASTFPTYLGPLARAYYFLTARLDSQQKDERKQLFGTWRDGLQPLKPYRWQLPEGELLEIPVTTMPLIKAPIHVSYLLYLSQFSGTLARAYFWQALKLCRLAGVQPSLLLHPLDFLGADDGVGLSFFPAMGMPSEKKVKLVSDILDAFSARFRVVSMREHAQQLLQTCGELPSRIPRSISHDASHWQTEDALEFVEQ